MSEDREDIRANVLGLRTFRLPRERRGPWISPVAISKDSTWEKGEAVARCQKCGDNVPGKNCYCGLHAYLTYGDLHGEYRAPAEHVVAVVRAEGKVWEHERGWRASEAYVEAIYLSDLARVSLEAKGFGDAPKESGIPIHSDLKAMLAEYGFDHESAARRRRPTPSIADSHFFWGLAGTPDWRAAHPGVRIRTGARSFFLFIALMVVLMVLGMTVFEFCWPRVMANPTTNVWESPYSWPLMAAAGLSCGCRPGLPWGRWRECPDRSSSLPSPS